MKNLILITTDQQRFDSLGCNGSDFVNTPNLDRIARQGARFDRAYCTNPVCTPSRVSILTGLLPSRHGSYNIGTYAADTSRFLSTVLTGAGYRTHHLGKLHVYPWDTASPETAPVGDGKPFTGLAGFETAEISVGHSDWGVNGHYEAWLAGRGIKKGCQMPQLQVGRLFEEDAYGCGDWGMPYRLHSGAWILERTEAFLRQRDLSRPFYLNIGFQDPHHPLVLPKDWPKILPGRLPRPKGCAQEGVAPQAALRRGTVEQDCGGRFGIAGNQNTVWQDVSGEKIQAARSYYYSMVELFDHQIGQLEALLKRFDAWEDTLLVITSDHGDMLYDHGLGEKGPVAYEEVLKVPLLLSLPGQIVPQTVEETVSLADLYPTVLSYLGLPCMGGTDGISLKGLLEGQTLPRCGVRAEFKEEADCIRYRCFITKEWKLVEYPGERFGELYCLAKDPGETKNLYDDPSCLAIKYELLKEMLRQQDQSDFLAQRPCRC